MRRFILAKKGKNIIEFIILFPITLFLIMYSVIQLVSFIVSAKVENRSTEYMRAMIVERNLYNSICSLGDKINEYGDDITIVSITISTSCDIKDCSEYIVHSYTLNFAEDSSETTYFKNLYKKGSGDTYSFNYNVNDTFRSSYLELNELWAQGNYIEITVMKPIAKVINSISKISIYDTVKKEKVTLNYGTSGVVYSNCRNVIIG